MNTKQLIVHYLIFAAILTGFGLWQQHYVKAEISHAIAAKEQADIRFWSDRLTPVYNDFKVKYVKNPTTWNEVFDPLVNAIVSVPAQVKSPVP